MWNSLIFYHWYLIPYSVSVIPFPFPDSVSVSGFRILCFSAAGSKQAKRSNPPWRKQTRLNSSKDNFIAKSSRLSAKRNLSTYLKFLFPLVSFIVVFSTLKWKTLVLKTTIWWTLASHFVDGWDLLRCQILLFPTPSMVVMTIGRLWGKGVRVI